MQRKRHRKWAVTLWVGIAMMALVAGQSPVAAKQSPVPPKLTKLPKKATSLGTNLPPERAPQTDFSSTAGREWTFRMCPPHKDGSACDPLKEPQFIQHVKWTRTNLDGNAQPVGTLTTETTKLPVSSTPGQVTAQAVVAPETTTDTDVGPPTDPSFTQPKSCPAGQVCPLNGDRTGYGGCCSDAGYAAINFSMDHQPFWGGPSYTWNVQQVWWWGGGQPGVNWGYAIPFGSQGWFSHLDGWAYQDAGWGPSLYNWYNYANRGNYTGFLWWPVRYLHNTVGAFSGGDVAPTAHIFVHDDGSWYVHLWDE